MGKDLARNAGKLRAVTKEHGPHCRGRPPCDQLRSPSNNVFGQEFCRTTRSKLFRKLPQGCRTQELAGSKQWSTVGLFLGHAMDGRHEAVSVVISVKQYGLVQLQLEFAADINAESHVGFSRPSMRVLIRPARTSTRISVSMTASAWRTLAGSFGRRGTMRLGSGVSWPQYSHSSSKHAMTASPGRKYSRMAGRGRSREW